jgi:hypothetical protein
VMRKLKFLRHQEGHWSKWSNYKNASNDIIL